MWWATVFNRERIQEAVSALPPNEVPGSGWQVRVRRGVNTTLVEVTRGRTRKRFYFTDTEWHDAELAGRSVRVCRSRAEMWRWERDRWRRIGAMPPSSYHVRRMIGRTKAARILDQHAAPRMWAP